jgi:hypothetical protein
MPVYRLAEVPVSIRQHTSAYVSIRSRRSTPPACQSIASPKYLSAYVSIRQHTSAYAQGGPHRLHASLSPRRSTCQHTSAYVSARQHTSEVPSDHSRALDVPAYVSIRQHTSEIPSDHSRALDVPAWAASPNSCFPYHACVLWLVCLPEREVAAVFFGEGVRVRDATALACAVLLRQYLCYSNW